MANVQQSNIAAGTPPNFMLPPYQADRSGQPVSISVSYQSWVPQERRTWEHLARHSWSPPCRGITGDLGRSTRVSISIVQKHQMLIEMHKLGPVGQVS